MNALRGALAAAAAFACVAVPGCGPDAGSQDASDSGASTAHAPPAPAGDVGVTQVLRVVDAASARTDEAAARDLALGLHAAWSGATLVLADPPAADSEFARLACLPRYRIEPCPGAFARATDDPAAEGFRDVAPRGVESCFTDLTVARILVNAVSADGTRPGAAMFIVPYGRGRIVLSTLAAASSPDRAPAFDLLEPLRAEAAAHLATVRAEDPKDSVIDDAQGPAPVDDLVRALRGGSR